MAMTTEQFDEMPMVAYSDARPQLRTGDILLFNSANREAELIEFGTTSLWSHAAFVWRLTDVDRVMLLESMDPVGVRMMPMSTRVDGCAAGVPYQGKLLVLRHREFPDPPAPTKLRLMTQFALDRVGFPYSLSELSQIEQRIILGMAGKIIMGRPTQENQFLCAEYVAKCFEVMGIRLAPDREGFIAPADIANDANVNGLFSLCPGKPHLERIN